MNKEIKQIAEFIEVDDFEIIEIDSITRDAISEYSNVYMFPSYFTADYLIFTSEAAYKHWLYYAGFEYLEEAPQILKKNNIFIAAYNVNNDTDGRIGQYLDIIQELNPDK